MDRNEIAFEKLRSMSQITASERRVMLKEMKWVEGLLLDALREQYSDVRASRVLWSEEVIQVEVIGIGRDDHPDLYRLQLALTHRVEVFAYGGRKVIRRNGLWFKWMPMPTTIFCIWRQL